MKRFVFILMATFLINQIAKAQTYYFATSVQPYSDLVGATSLNGSQTWQWFNNYKVPIGFNFPFFGDNKDSVEIYETGNLLFNYWGDTALFPYATVELIDRAYGSGSSVSESPISYKLDGTPGSYILKIEWKNFGFRHESPKIPVNGLQTTYFANMQVWLYENGDFEFRYGPSHIIDSVKIYNGTTGPIVGYLIEPQGEFNLDGNPRSPIYTKVIGQDYKFLIGHPDNGRVYHFSLNPNISVKSFDIDKDLKIYPNPLKDKLTIETSFIGRVEILDINGRVLKSNGIGYEFKKVDVDVSGLSHGIYMLRLIDDKGKTYFNKLIK